MKYFVFEPYEKDVLRYICNQAVNPSCDKMTRIIGKVSCKNCINILMNRTLVVIDYGV